MIRYPAVDPIIEVPCYHHPLDASFASSFATAGILGRHVWVVTGREADFRGWRTTYKCVRCGFDVTEVGAGASFSSVPLTIVNREPARPAPHHRRVYSL